MMGRKILYSPGFGAGWSSWCGGSSEQRLFMLEYAPIIAAVESGQGVTDSVLKQFKADWDKEFPGVHVCVLGADDLKVAEVEGQVRIAEYDGNESYVTRATDTEWL